MKKILFALALIIVSCENNTIEKDTKTNNDLTFIDSSDPVVLEILNRGFKLDDI